MAQQAYSRPCTSTAPAMLSPCLAEQCSPEPPLTPTLTHHTYALGSDASRLKLASTSNIGVNDFQTLKSHLGTQAAGDITPF